MAVELVARRPGQGAILERLELQDTPAARRAPTVDPEPGLRLVRAARVADSIRPTLRQPAAKAQLVAQPSMQQARALPDRHVATVALGQPQSAVFPLVGLAVVAARPVAPGRRARVVLVRMAVAAVVAAEA
ncbi:MAG: hypothetical protein QM757_16635 [Paludibaculum sp.]